MHDAELRQERKSASQRFKGHWAAVAMEVLPGKAGPKPALERGVMRTKFQELIRTRYAPLLGHAAWIRPTELGSNCSLRIPTIRLAA